MNYYLLIEYKEQGFVLEKDEYYEFYRSEIFDSYHDFVDIIASFNTCDLFMENFSEHLNLCQKYTAVEKTFLKEPYSWFGVEDVQLYVIESKSIIQDFSKLERDEWPDENCFFGSMEILNSDEPHFFETYLS